MTHKTNQETDPLSNLKAELSKDKHSSNLATRVTCINKGIREAIVNIADLGIGTSVCVAIALFPK